jgi:hypothetical protein
VKRRKKPKNLSSRSGCVTSIPEVKDQRWTIPLGRNLAVRRALLAAELVLILEENRRSESFPRVINSNNSGRKNHPPSMVK